MARAVLITNPAAARTTHASVRAVSDALHRAGWSLEVMATVGPGDARRIAADAVRLGVDVVAVQGGDGTTMQAASALVGTDVALGLIPGGTGNLLAGNLRIPRSASRAARILAAGTRRRIDLGRLDQAHHGTYFSVACGAGIDARVMGQTTTELKRRWGIGAYMATTIRLLPEISSFQAVITVDGTEYEAEAAMVLVANCGEVIPPFVRLGHGITPDDGLLDVVVVRGRDVWDTVRAVWHVMSALPGAGGDGTFIGYARGRTVRVETDVVQPTELDGEAGGVTPFTAEVVPGAISVLVPPG
jgi:YegS/Rv2252/BmrU family lipid kinase